MMRFNTSGGGATNERPAEHMCARTPSNSNADASNINATKGNKSDDYEGRCTSLTMDIVQLKLELAEAKVCIRGLRGAFITFCSKV
jgi:hypothetical protein